MNSLAYCALWFFIFSIPWERILTLPGVYIVTKAAGAFALVLVLFAVVVSGRMRRFHPFHGAALLFVVWAGIRAMLTDYHRLGFPGKYWTFVQLFLVLCMIWELAPDRKRLLGLFSAYVLGAYVAALDTIVLYHHMGEMMRRFAAGGADPNDLAMLLALALPMSWYLGMNYRKPFVVWACRGYLIVGLLALGLTGSRGGMVAAMVGLSIVPLTLTQLSAGKRILGSVLVCAGVVVVFIYTPTSLIERLASTGTDLTDAHVGGRGRIWAAGLKAFALQPFFGYGTGMFRTAVNPFGINQVAHNAFLSVLVEQGMVGLLLYLGMFGMVFLSIQKLRYLDRRFTMVLFATVIVTMLPLTWEDDKVVWFVLAALIGLGNAPQPAPQRSPVWQPPRPVPLRERAGIGGLARGAAARTPPGRLDARD
jgi:O-antigen ligase